MYELCNVTVAKTAYSNAADGLHDERVCALVVALVRLLTKQTLIIHFSLTNSAGKNLCFPPAIFLATV